MNANQIGGVIRALVPAVLAYLAGKGLILDGGAVADTLVGIVGVIASIWSWKSNKPGTVIPAK